MSFDYEHEHQHEHEARDAMTVRREEPRGSAGTETEMSHRGRTRIMAGMLLLLALGVPSLAWGQSYRIVDMGVGEPYFPTALNNRGQVLLTNNSLTPARIGLFLASAPFLPRWSGPASLLWDNGSTSAIGLLPGGTYSRGCGLNDAGQVAGFGDKMTPYSTCLDEPSRAIHAFIWQGGAADLDPGVEVIGQDGTPCQVFIVPSLALGINNQGQVTGWMGSPFPSGDYNHGALHAFRTAGGQLDHEADDLTPGTPAVTQGWFINNAGTVLGTQLGGGYAFFGGGGGLPPAGGIVYAMNDSGATVGVAGGHAFVSGAAAALPSSFEAALGINNQGQIVGQGTMGDRQHALLYREGHVVDLEGALPAGSGWELFQAALINDQGQIVVWGSHNGRSTFGLLTPEELELTLRLQPPKGCGDEPRKGTVHLQPAAPPGGVAVHLSSTPELQGLPETLAFAEGETDQSFEVTPPSSADTVTYQITASIESSGVSTEADLGVDPPELTDLKLSDDQVCSDDPAMGTVTLSCPAPPEGLMVTLQSKSAFSPLQVTLPSAVKIEAGKTSATFAITPGFYNSKASGESVTIIASYRGTTRSAELKVQPTIDSLMLIPTSVTAGQTATATIHLNCPAPAGGRAVLVQSTDPSIAFVNADHPDLPFIFVVPEGSETFFVKVQTRPVASTRMVTIGASTPASTDSDDLTVMPAR